MVIALLSALVLMGIYFSPKLIWFAPVGAIALSYTLALIPYRGGWLRLRDIPYLKIFLIVGVVTYITVCLPMLYQFSAEIFWSSMMLIAFSRALFLFAITLPFDIRDLDFDRNTNLKTIPGRIGVKKSKVLSLVALALFAVTELIIYNSATGSGTVCTALIISAIVASVFIIKAKPNGTEYYYSLGLEGTMIIQLLLVILAQAIDIYWLFHY